MTVKHVIILLVGIILLILSIPLVDAEGFEGLRTVEDIEDYVNSLDFSSSRSSSSNIYVDVYIDNSFSRRCLRHYGRRPLAPRKNFYYPYRGYKKERNIKLIPRKERR